MLTTTRNELRSKFKETEPSYRSTLEANISFALLLLPKLDQALQKYWSNFIVIGIWFVPIGMIVGAAIKSIPDHQAAVELVASMLPGAGVGFVTVLVFLPYITLLSTIAKNGRATPLPAWVGFIAGFFALASTTHPFIGDNQLSDWLAYGVICGGGLGAVCGISARVPAMVDDEVLKALAEAKDWQEGISAALKFVPPGHVLIGLLGAPIGALLGIPWGAAVFVTGKLGFGPAVDLQDLATIICFVLFGSLVGFSCGASGG